MILFIGRIILVKILQAIFCVLVLHVVGCNFLLVCERLSVHRCGFCTLQQEQYEELYTTIRRRTGGGVFPVIPPIEKKPELERKRSKSHSDLIAVSNMTPKILRN